MASDQGVRPRLAADSLKGELQATIRLAAPIMLNQVGMMSMAMVDTLVAGHIGTAALAGLGLAANFYWTFTSVCIGCLLGLDTEFSQRVGAGDNAGLARYLGQSIWSCALLVLAAGAAVCRGQIGARRCDAW